MPRAGGREYRFAQGIERAGTDVAIDDTDAAEREPPEAGMRTNLVAATGRHRAPGWSDCTICHEC